MRRIALCLAICQAGLLAQQIVTVRPQEIDDVLINPGIGFMTFHRANGGPLNPSNKNHPETTMDYLRVYWNFFEPERGQYRWDLIENTLKTAESRGQTLLFRIMPYGTDRSNDVPTWYRAMMGPEPQWNNEKSKVRTNPEDPRYVQYFGGMVREIGRRYDGHPALEAIDVSIIGAWGEGAGSAQLTQPTREALVNAYLESFEKTPLITLLTDEKTNKYGISKRDLGWRVDCLGDMNGFNPTWSHMFDYYPQGIINFGMRDAWKKAPVSFEACWVMGHWKKNGWDVDYIIDQSLKWRISSFNGKSSEVPEEWRPAVDRWLKRMGYRFVLRKFTYPEEVAPLGKIAFTTWWENKGVAPCYRKFDLALRLKNGSREEVLITDADIRTWLPGDNLYDDAVFVPAGVPPGQYDLDLAIVDPATRKAKVKLAIEGIKPDGWYNLGKVNVR